VFGALVLGLVNATVRSVLVVLTLPITVLTIGLFCLVVNGAAFALAAGLVPAPTGRRRRIASPADALSRCRASASAQ
jgi:uncharacterized membrane protein YvlD (DUF360 family)